MDTQPLQRNLFPQLPIPSQADVIATLSPHFPLLWHSVMDPWEEFLFYQYRREEFLKHYHQRSNVESTFSAVKRKFGDSLRSRNDVAMVNEALAKFVCHNICRVILSQIELGVEAEFWEEDDGKGEEVRDVLPMVRRG